MLFFSVGKLSALPGPPALGGQHVVGRWLEVYETNAKALEARSLGSSLTTVGHHLLVHPHNPLSFQ